MALRNKTLAVTMILNGWHPIDAYRMKETDVTDVPNYRDRSGHHRPKIIFAGEETHHTKVHSIKVRNTIGCGCQSNHDPRDVRCFYNVVKEYIVEKDKSDEMFMRDCYPRLSKQARLLHTFIFEVYFHVTRSRKIYIPSLNKRYVLVHVSEQGVLRPINFFRAMNRKGEERCTFVRERMCIFTRTWETPTFEQCSSGGIRS